MIAALLTYLYAAGMLSTVLFTFVITQAWPSSAMQRFTYMVSMAIWPLFIVLVALRTAHLAAKAR